VLSNMPDCVNDLGRNWQSSLVAVIGRENLSILDTGGDRIDARGGDRSWIGRNDDARRPAYLSVIFRDDLSSILVGVLDGRVSAGVAVVEPVRQGGNPPRWFGEDLGQPWREARRFNARGIRVFNTRRNSSAHHSAHKRIDFRRRAAYIRSGQRSILLDLGRRPGASLAVAFGRFLLYTSH